MSPLLRHNALRPKLQCIRIGFQRTLTPSMEETNFKRRLAGSVAYRGLLLLLKAQNGNYRFSETAKQSAANLPLT